MNHWVGFCCNGFRRHIEHAGVLEISRLLHINSSVQGNVSVTRRPTARAAARWRAAHPGGAVTYRDLGTNPIPHLDAATGLARMVAAEQRTAAEDASLALNAKLTDLIALGLSIDAETHAGLLGDTDFIVLASRGGGYGSGMPREGWDHAQTWLPHAVSLTGLAPRFITAELTTADSDPKLAHLKPLAAESINKALTAINQLRTGDEGAA